jgi:hypothetical protein
MSKHAVIYPAIADESIDPRTGDLNPAWAAAFIHDLRSGHSPILGSAPEAKTLMEALERLSGDAEWRVELDRARVAAMYLWRQWKAQTAIAARHLALIEACPERPLPPRVRAVIAADGLAIRYHKQAIQRLTGDYHTALKRLVTLLRRRAPTLENAYIRKVWSSFLWAGMPGSLELRKVLEEAHRPSWRGRPSTGEEIVRQVLDWMRDPHRRGPLRIAACVQFLWPDEYWTDEDENAFSAGVADRFSCQLAFVHAVGRGSSKPLRKRPLQSGIRRLQLILEH